jgi:NADPH-dependent curcumin reductase CurA
VPGIRLWPARHEDPRVRSVRANRQIVIGEIPTGKLTPEHFRSVTSPLPAPAPGQVLCRTILLSPDPVNRSLMRGASYRGGLQRGDVMPGFGIAEVIDPAGTELTAGTVVSCEPGWQEHAALALESLVPVQVCAPLTYYMSALGITGLTAYFGLLQVGRPRTGETVVVSAAAGATGNVVGQLARIRGCRVVGITGSEPKARVLERELEFDAAVSHRSQTLFEDLRAACPDGIDVYFDNVGGPVLDACLRLMNERGRVVCCGLLSGYDAAQAPPGPRAVPGLVISRRLRLEGFVVLDYVARWASARAEMARWIDAGRIRVLEEVVEGLEAAPSALVDVLGGRNLGKRIVRVGPDPPALRCRRDVL